MSDDMLTAEERRLFEPHRIDDREAHDLRVHGVVARLVALVREERRLRGEQCDLAAQISGELADALVRATNAEALALAESERAETLRVKLHSSERARDRLVSALAARDADLAMCRATLASHEGGAR